MFRLTELVKTHWTLRTPSGPTRWSRQARHLELLSILAVKHEVLWTRPKPAWRSVQLT